MTASKLRTVWHPERLPAAAAGVQLGVYARGPFADGRFLVNVGHGAYSPAQALELARAIFTAAGEAMLAQAAQPAQGGSDGSTAAGLIPAPPEPLHQRMAEPASSSLKIYADLTDSNGSAIRVLESSQEQAPHVRVLTSAEGPAAARLGLAGARELRDALSEFLNYHEPAAEISRLASQVAAGRARDWTIDPATGRSNSGRLFKEIEAVVTREIIDGAPRLLRGGAAGVAGGIVARLAHVYGLTPRDWPEQAGDEQAGDEQAGREELSSDDRLRLHLAYRHADAEAGSRHVPDSALAYRHLAAHVAGRFHPATARDGSAGQLRLHVTATHANAAGPGLSAADALDYHYQEHYGPGGIRDHDYADWSHDESKLAEVLAGRDYALRPEEGRGEGSGC
jgi:hypothetical protein